jgi:hypothetical protein
MQVTALAMCRASHWVCDTGVNWSSAPCQSRTGTLISSTSKPQPFMLPRAIRSSCQPYQFSALVSAEA